MVNKMKANGILSKFFLILLSLSLLTACNNGSKSADPKAVYTSAAQTVAAQLTSIGPLTPAPSATPFPSITPIAATVASIPTAAMATMPAASPTTNPSVADKAQYISQNPADGVELAANSTFTMIWTVKNVGKTTWKTSYQLRFYAGAPLGNTTSVYIPKSVAPNEQVDISVPLTAPASAGEYNSMWVMSNADGVNFQPLTLALKVIAGPTATITSTITPTGQSATATATSTTAAATETPTTAAQ
jgi:hypothetical protein